MNAVALCASLDEVRSRIDRLDRQWVALIAGRLARAALHPPSSQPH